MHSYVKPIMLNKLVTCDYLNMLRSFIYGLFSLNNNEQFYNPEFSQHVYTLTCTLTSF